MGAQHLLALAAKRSEFIECIRLLERKPISVRSLEDIRLMDRLRLKVDWIDKSLGLEQQQPEPIADDRSNAA